MNDKYKLIQQIPQIEDDAYIDEYGTEKGILTDFINNHFLKCTKHQVYLIEVIYKTLTPIMEKYGVYLVFKGGNVMRMINENVLNNLYNLPSTLIMDVFKPFLKKSDNDFTIFVDPNTPKYEEFMRSLSFDVFNGLAKIRDKINKNKSKYFQFFEINEREKRKLYKQLSAELNSRSVRLYPISDKIIKLAEPDKKNSVVDVYENTTKSPNYFYNSLNFSLEFIGGSFDINVKFYLLRSKINFLVSNRINIGGELIDISITHKDDTNFKKLNTSAKFRNYIQTNVISMYNKKLNFDYYVVNTNYLIHDLIRILYIQNAKPWNDKKYIKRVARLIYFIFVDHLNTFKLSINGLNKLKNEFRNFTQSLEEGIDITKTNNNEHLQIILILTYNLSADLVPKNKSKFSEYVKNLVKYSYAIQRIISSILRFLQGSVRFSDDFLFTLN